MKKSKNPIVLLLAIVFIILLCTSCVLIEPADCSCGVVTQADAECDNPSMQVLNDCSGETNKFSQQDEEYQTGDYYCDKNLDNW